MASLYLSGEVPWHSSFCIKPRSFWSAGVVIIGHDWPLQFAVSILDGASTGVVFGCPMVWIFAEPAPWRIW
jgi:hypothetical protein